jgi:ubiquinone/menaquinone biosynthesis C-methylase UbiE
MRAMRETPGMSDIKEIIEYYNLGGERERLYHGPSQIEGIRTQELIYRHLPSNPQKIADIGGGAGFYAHWLADQGHEVHFLDAAPDNVKVVIEANANRDRRLASIHVGDARNLPYESDTFDFVLMLGPLYHLIGQKDRLAALREGQRVLKRGGTLFAATISRYASMLGGFFTNLVEDAEFVEIMKLDLKTGVHRNPTPRDYFTSAYFHTPTEIVSELQLCGFTSVKWYAVEGFAWLLQNVAEPLKDDSKCALLLDLLRQVEAEETLAGLSAHLLTVGTK